LGEKRDELPVALKYAADLPVPAVDFREFASGEAATLGVAVDDVVYEMITNGTLPPIHTGYTHDPSGIYYPAFFPRRKVKAAANAPLFVCEGVRKSEYVQMPRKPLPGPRTTIYVRVDPKRLYIHLGLPPQPLGGSGVATTSFDGGEMTIGGAEVMYTNVGGPHGVAGGGGGSDDEIEYTTIGQGGSNNSDMNNNTTGGGGASDVVYSAVEVGGGIGGMELDMVEYTAIGHGEPMAAAADSGGVLYSAVDFGGGVTSYDEGHSGGGRGRGGESEVMYSAVEIGGGGGNGGGGGGESEVMYTAVEVGENYNGFGDASSTPAAQPPPRKGIKKRGASGGSFYGGFEGPPEDEDEDDDDDDDDDEDDMDLDDIPVTLPTKKATASKPKATSSQAQKQARRVHQAGGVGGGMSTSSSLSLKEAAPAWLHDVSRAEAEARIKRAGGTNGLFLVRPKDASGKAHAFSVLVSNRFVHRLIQQHTNGTYTVDNIKSEWGTTLREVVASIQAKMTTKYKVQIVPVKTTGAEEFC
jgi:hypothetical protein